MVEVISWKVWYTQGRAFCSTGTAPEDLPEDGCLGFTLLLNQWSGETQHRRIMNSCNWYFVWEGPEGVIYGHSDEDDIVERYPGAVIIRGKWTTEDEMNRVLKKMQDWHGTGLDSN